MADVAENARYHDVVFSQARRWADVSKSDTVNFTELPKAIYVGGAGDLVLRLAGEAADITLAAVPAGTLLPLRVSHVRATSSATLLVALY